MTKKGRKGRNEILKEKNNVLGNSVAILKKNNKRQNIYFR